MFCQQCGAENSDSAYKCLRCETVLQHPTPLSAPKAPNEVPPTVPPYAQPPTVSPYGQPPMASPYGQPPSLANIPNYLPQAILVTLFCCMPFGIAAIVFASQVNSKVTSGDFAGATASSDKAKLWCWLAFGFGIPVQLTIAGLQIFQAVMSASSSAGH